MIRLTPNERKALLIVFKGMFQYYNANSLSKVLGISRVGTMKILKKCLKEGILQSETIGKSIVYKIKLKDDYTRNLIAFLLAEEAQKYKQWKWEFEDLFKEERIIILFGSVLLNDKEAKDIDLMVVLKKDDKSEWNEINSVIKKKESILPKGIHFLPFVEKELILDVKERNKVLVDIVKNSIILHGQYRYVEMMNNVTNF